MSQQVKATEKSTLKNLQYNLKELMITEQWNCYCSQRNFSRSEVYCPSNNKVDQSKISEIVEIAVFCSIVAFNGNFGKLTDG